MKKEIFYCDICGKEVPDVIQIKIPIVRFAKIDHQIDKKALEYRSAHVDACDDCAEEISKTVRKLCCDRSLAIFYAEKKD